MADKKKQTVCLLVRVTRPSGCDNERIDVEVGERSFERDDGCEYPRTPDEINELHTANGGLGLFNWVLDGRISIDRPEYHRLAYVDSYKLANYGKTLALLERRMAKMRDTRGYVTSWGEQVLRFGEACGAKWIAFPAAVIERIDRQRGRERPRDMAGQKWAFFSPGDAADLLRALQDNVTAASTRPDLVDVAKAAAQ